MMFKLSRWQLNTAQEILSMRKVKLRQVPTIDKLTGLVNYHGLSRTVEREIKRSKRSGREFAVLVYDLKGMDPINTCYGHRAGDRALSRLANIFRSSCRFIDTAARYGDDKIVIILPECGAKAADSVDRRISERLSMDREEPLLAVNVGIASYPEDGKTLDALFQAAVRALYEKKEWAQDTATHSEFLPRVTSKQKGFLFHLRSISGLMRESRGWTDEP